MEQTAEGTNQDEDQQQFEKKAVDSVEKGALGSVWCNDKRWTHWKSLQNMETEGNESMNFNVNF